ncbi:TPR-like protein [Coprinopsis marcescibilis]|uniref:TPR-like protein n=1 Tax=Coprinopsis marcescibilis TaxID=230819 RepID=A0A5C3LET3_COPMA|nr:TPR-like protein [Coprinopsis marcescibilis]
MLRFDPTTSDESSEEEDLSSNSEDEIEDIEQGTKNEIDGDFDQIIQGIRSKDGPNLAKDWDLNFAAEKEAEFRDDLREASGVGRKRRKKGRTAGPVLSQQVKALIGDGNQAYIDNNIPEAIRQMSEVIRIEPRAASAWSVLAQCYEDLGEMQTALKLRVMAAHLRHDADEWDRLARQSRDLGFNQQALYCYRKVNNLDPENLDAYWDRAALAKETGDVKTAKNAFLAILKRFPHDMTVLRELHPILVELNDLPMCAQLLQHAFDFHQRNGAALAGTFSNLDVLLLADLHNALGEYDRAVDVIRKGIRWLQGREEQRYWDLCEDDREYDIPNISPREGGAVDPGYFDLDTNARHRLAVARIKMGDIEEGKRHANIVLAEDVLDYAVLFSEIADAYFDRELWAEAKPIYELLGGDPATSSIYILLQTAACMRNMEQLKEAAEVYEHIRLADPSHNDARMKLAEIYEILGETRRALDLVYEVIDSRKKRKGGTNQPSTQSGNAEAGPSTITTSLFAEERATGKTKGSVNKPQNRLTHAQLRDLESEKEREVIRGFKKLKDLWQFLSGPTFNQTGAGNVGEQERLWMLEAEKLVDMFRETRNLFLTSRNNPFRGMFPRNKKRQQSEAEADEDRMASRLQLDLERDSLAKSGKSKQGQDKSGVDVFRGVSFGDWLKMIIQYCFILTQRGHYDLADEILRHVLVSNAYQAQERQDAIRVAIITCAIHAQNFASVVDQCRKFITRHQFNNEPLRLLLACLASGLRPTDAFITSTLQKHLFREMKLADMAVKSPESLRWNSLNKRWAGNIVSKGEGKKGAGGDEDVDGEEDAEGEEEDGDEGAGETVTVISGSGSEPAQASSAHVEKASGAAGTELHVEGRSKLPTKHNPVLVTIYGQICIAAKSYQSAIFYLLHAYDYSPNDPMICLCLAIASVGRAMQRQSDNRHHLIAQGMAFLSQYRNLRGKDPRTLREVEYNFGRIFHQLGLYSYAVKHYERVLEMAEQQNEPTYAKEAAYNLSLIFVFTGATPLAENLYRKWLSL